MKEIMSLLNFHKKRESFFKRSENGIYVEIRLIVPYLLN